MIRKYLTLISTALISIQSLAANSGYKLQENIVEVNQLYYEIKDTQYLSEKNEFNTHPEELDDIEITPYWINQTNLNKIPQPTEHKLKVCIIDSGVDSTHTDLPQASITGYYSSYGGFWGEDSVGHGTHISGIISALNNGTGVRGAIDNGYIDIHIQKLMQSARGANSIIDDKSLIESIEICAAAGAKVINLSLSGEKYSKDLRDVIDRLTEQNNIIFVAAAGNHGTATGIDRPVYPAAYRNVVGVGAVNINGELADFSPSYKGVSFVAPGLDILSAIPYSNSRVSSVYYESEDGYFDFDHYQIDRGFEYPSNLPTQDFCYHNLSSHAVSEQVIDNKLSENSKNEIREASLQCVADGGSMLVLSYNYLDTLKQKEFEKYDSWLTSIDYEAEMPILLIPGLNENEINLFKEGNIKVSSTKQGYAALTGTSQSAGIVTAGIAKLWSNYPNATATQILNSLKGTASQLSRDYPANAVGNGLVNFGAAYEYLKNYNSAYIPPACPDEWYDNKSYQAAEEVTFNGFIYRANYWSKDQFPDVNSYEYGPWKKVGKCDEPNENTYEHTQDNDPFYALKAIERIAVSYKCTSYSLSCGGGGGFGGFSFIGGGYSGGGYSGEGGGGGGSSSNSEEDKEEADKKQKEYEDIKKRSDNTPPQKPGESNENYNKRLSEYYKNLADDYKKWDDKYNKGRHAQKIQDINNRATKYEKAYQNEVRHREVTQRYENSQKNRSRICTARTTGVVKAIQTIGCLIEP